MPAKVQKNLIMYALLPAKTAKKLEPTSPFGLVAGPSAFGPSYALTMRKKLFEAPLFCKVQVSKVAVSILFYTF